LIRGQHFILRDRRLAVGADPEGLWFFGVTFNRHINNSLCFCQCPANYSLITLLHLAFGKLLLQPTERFGRLSANHNPASRPVQPVDDTRSLAIHAFDTAAQPSRDSRFRVKSAFAVHQHSDWLADDHADLILINNFQLDLRNYYRFDLHCVNFNLI
jgi:hypothetical protein